MLLTKKPAKQWKRVLKGMSCSNGRRFGVTNETIIIGFFIVV